MKSRCRVLGAAVLGAVLGAAVPGAAQGRITNARTETRSAVQGLDREVRAVVARGTATWIGYRVPMIAGPRQMCCYDSMGTGVPVSGVGTPVPCCGTCRLESGGGVTMTTGDARGSRITLEPPTEFLILARVEAGAVMRVRTFTPDCDVDASGMPLVWLTDVKPDESVAWLSSLVSGAGSDSERVNRVANPALSALAFQSGQPAIEALIGVARTSPVARVRGQALFWLAHKAGQQAMATITNAIENDPETDVKKRAVFALSQLPKDEGVPRLMEVARTNRNAEVRKQAMFWLGESKDPRAVKFFEDILLKK
ncbi:MAG: HEAT repeat domain-containing protein [Acidobacteriia bacterium]|nr:HEAT repeat domain-containing protein [Terriglobia bacterium]